MTITELRERIPSISTKLAAMLAGGALDAFEEADITLDDASPSVSMTLRHKDGGPGIRFTLGVEQVSEDDED